MKNLKAFHGSPALKAKYLARVRQHREADELVKGKYWEQGKGCAVGCTLEDRYNEDKHMAYETDLGIPVALARLEDSIFEGLPNAKAMLWPERFLDAIRPGADLTGVADKFMLAVLVDDQHGCVRHADERGKQAVDGVAALLRRKIAGKTITAAEWNAADHAAEAAAAAYAASFDAARAAEHASYSADRAASFAACAAYSAASASFAEASASFAEAAAEAAEAADSAAIYAARAARTAYAASYADSAAHAASAASAAGRAAEHAFYAARAARAAARIWQADTLIAQLQAA
jgi:hypothetical protein